MTDRKTRTAAYATVAVLSLGLSGSPVAASERHAAQPAAADGHHIVQAQMQVQEPGRSGSSFSAAPEFPPMGYLEEFDDSAQGRLERPAQDFARDSFPPPAGASAFPGLSPDFPEYAPYSQGSRVPSSGLPRQTEPWGAGSGSARPIWDDPAFTPPVPGQDWPMPPSEAAGPWGESPSMPSVGRPRDPGDYPSMPPEPQHRGWSGYPSEDPRWANPGTLPGGSPDQPWPGPQAPGGSYPSYQEYEPHSWDRASPETPQGRFPSYRDEPPRDYGRQR